MGHSILWTMTIPSPEFQCLFVGVLLLASVAPEGWGLLDPETLDVNNPVFLEDLMSW